MGEAHIEELGATVRSSTGFVTWHSGNQSAHLGAKDRLVLSFLVTRGTARASGSAESVVQAIEYLFELPAFFL